MKYIHYYIHNLSLSAITRLQSLYAAAGLDPTNSTGYVWNVTWGTGSSVTSNVNDPGHFHNISTIDDQYTFLEINSSNILWRATLKSLSFMPMLNADYSGGVIITDWYSENINSDEQIKITIRFLNNEIRADSIDVIAHKKKCDVNNKCSQTLLGNSFSREIKDSILTIARQIKIEEEKIEESKNNFLSEHLP